MDCGLRLRDRKREKERGHRSEIKHFCGKATKLPLTLIQDQFCISPLGCWRLWYVDWIELNFYGGQGGRTPQEHCLTAAANQNTNLTHSRAQTANQSSTMDMFWTRPAIWFSEQTHSRAWASPPGEQSDLAVVTEMDREGLEKAAVFLRQKKEEEKVKQGEEVELLSRLSEGRTFCQISTNCMWRSQRCSKPSLVLPPVARDDLKNAKTQIFLNHTYKLKLNAFTVVFSRQF